ncbi:DUF2441 domain-containing protein [Microbacterium sp. NPDC057659]|uniref:DUF2441 domain-containing protein n=1 Tax=Microbacterium sp. NPDC057659 TaxID=3346198 RepID=UPI00366F7016
MTSMIAFHVVTERPMSVGQRIAFDETNRSGVWRRVQEQADEVARIYADAEQAPPALDHLLAVAFRELAMEEVRLVRFPQHPSRLSSLYVSETLADAESWCALFISWGRPTYQIVRLEITGRRFSGDARNCFTGTADRTENLRLAEQYWAGHDSEQAGEPIVETLVDGEIDVVEIVRTVNANLPDPVPAAEEPGIGRSDCDD